VSLAITERLFRLQAPEGNRFILRRSRHLLGVRTEAQGTDLAVVAGELARQPPLAQLPDANDAVIVTGGQETRIAAKGQGGHPGRLPERDQKLGAGHVPDRGRVAGGGEETAVRAELPGRFEIAKEVIRALAPV